jgi:hypothetical protein
MMARTWLSGRSSNSTPAAAGTAAGCAAPPAEAASTSRRTTRPPGPLPCTSRRSTPDWAAILRASGEAFTRPDAAEGTGADVIG